MLKEALASPVARVGLGIAITAGSLVMAEASQSPQATEQIASVKTQGNLGRIGLKDVFHQDPTTTTSIRTFETLPPTTTTSLPADLERNVAPKVSRSARRTVPATVVPATTTTVAKHNVATGGGRDLGVFDVTCYTLKGGTATGHQVQHGAIAVDPSVIPMNTHLSVDEYGEGWAWDTGSAIKGRRLDVWMSDASACANWGHQYVDVRIIP